GGTHAEGARKVAGGEDHAAATGMADDHRLARDLRAVSLLDGGVEGVAVDVGDAKALDLGMGNDAPAATARAARLDAIGDLAAIPAQLARCRRACDLHDSRACHRGSAEERSPAGIFANRPHWRRPLPDLCVADA